MTGSTDIRYDQGFFHSHEDRQIFFQSWLPRGEPCAVIIIVHGMGEHSGRYMNLVNRFVPLGFAVYGLDHTGHGRSEGRRKFIRNFSVFTRTLDQFLERVKAAHSQQKVFLMGHSMGGAITLSFLLDYPGRVEGAVLSGPAVMPPPAFPGVVLAAGKLLGRFLPWLRVVRTDFEGMSRDPAVVQDALADPLIPKVRTTAGLAGQTLEAMARIRSECGRITGPVLILQGSADRLVDPEGGPFLYDRIGSQDKTLKIYEGLFHEVLSEPEHEQVLDDVQVWVEKRM